MESLLAEERAITVWALTPVEVISALWRLRRAGHIDESERLSAEILLADLERTWSVISDLPRVVHAARRLFSIHPLRAADALQLAAALTAFEEVSEPITFVTLDLRLAEAARREGFEVITR